MATNSGMTWGPSPESRWAPFRPGFWTSPQAVKLTFALWIVASVVLIATKPAYVFDEDRDAAIRWLHGEPLYNSSGYGFIYLPHAVVMWIPWALMSEGAALFLGRLANVAVFAWGTYSLARLACPQRSARLFPIATLIALPLVDSCMRAGQMTLTLGGMMMLAVVAVADHRWKKAALWLTLAVCFKPHGIVLWMLVAAIHPRARKPLLVAAAIAATLPFAFQNTSYVAAQYVECFHCILGSVNLGLEQRNNEFAHLYTLLASLGLDLNSGAQLVISMIAALATLGAGWLAIRKHPRHQAALLLFTLAAGYVLIFNPRTERNTYALIAPAMGVWAAQWLVLEGRKRFAGFVVALVVLSVSSHSLSKILWGESTTWLKPSICLVFLLLVALAQRSASTAPDDHTERDGKSAKETDGLVSAWRSARKRRELRTASA